MPPRTDPTRCWEAPAAPSPHVLSLLGLSGGDGARTLELLRRQRLERPVIFVGTGTCGLGAGAGKTLLAVRRHLEARGIDADVVEVGCIGLCSDEPLVDVQFPGRERLSYRGVTEDKVPALLDGVWAGQVKGPSLVGQFSSPGLEPWPKLPRLEDHPFFAPQTRWVLANCGIIDPASLREYAARGGYAALHETLANLTPEAVCDAVERSGLRGRGGGGFPSGRKWHIARRQEATQKYLICNADEGDPGAFMDRAVIEGDPHRLVEGMAIAGYAIGASQGYVYIRAEYPLAIRRLAAAIEQARAVGLLGKGIFGTSFDFDIRLKQGAGAFVCGEETALINSIEGRRGMPRPRPPYPAERGAFGKPTVINNVETLANVPVVIGRGADAFAAVGTEGSKGTKVFALSGKVSRTGLAEVAMGTTVRQIVFEVGGGIPDGKAYKAVQIGGPSGGCIPASHLDIQVDYESLKSVGAMMGSGGLVVMDEGTCMVDVAKFFMDFIQRESCGKCIPCREGTRRMLEVLEAITRGRRSEKDADALERFQGVMALNELADVIKDTSLCGLGQSAPNPVLSTLRWFRDEYEAHVYDRRCPAGVCAQLLTYTIDEEACRGCTLCLKKCPTGAIMGAPKSPHYVIQDKCIACGTCLTVCRTHAVLVS
jgi:NADH:ubiquinone oxidoreductase subunit F (NADH-binding)/Pyruvate/2-oxoacid:ferredoxin oxidoreductase delta subunit